MPLPGLPGCAASRVPRLACLVMIGMLMIVLNAGCGKRGPVRPKLATPPPPPEELTLQQQGNLFVLGWTIPRAGQDGSGEHELTGFRIKRLSYDAAAGCPTCRDPQDEVAELDIRHPTPGQRIGKRIYWRDLDILPGSGYRYAIVPTILGGAEGPAATIHLAAQQPPPAPAGLQATAGNALVTLQWDAPELPAEMQLVGYNLYRRQGQRPFPIVPLNANPLQERQLLDRGLDNGRTYEYRVSAVVRSAGQQLESMASPGALATPGEGR